MADRKPLICGNWKMHHNHFEAIQTVQKLSLPPAPRTTTTRSTSRCTRRSPTCARCRPSLEADEMPDRARRAALPLGGEGRLHRRGVARRCWPSSTSRYVIAGHSERRELFGETDEMVNKKVKAILRGRDDADPVLRRDARGARGRRHRGQGRRARSAPGWRASAPSRSPAWSIAYEPIWAIGTGRTATPRTPRRCARWCGRRSPRSPARRGGRGAASSTAARSSRRTRAELMAQPDIDGALVGGASLDPGGLFGDRAVPQPDLTARQPTPRYDGPARTSVQRH